jgi:ribonuclease HII
MNIHRASLAAMARAVMELKQAPDFCLIDGQFNVPNLNFPQMAVVHGDSLCRAIAAASVVAKVTRDRIMERYEAMYPMFSFATHKGYTTPENLQELEKHGPCDIHRRSYRPVAKLLYECNLF